MNAQSKSHLVSFLIAQAACFTAAGIGGAFTATSVDTWYRAIEKPEWTPPQWLFGPVWTVLYFMMGLAVWLVWRKSGWSNAKTALVLFALQLGLNAIWSMVFFGAQAPGPAFIEIAVLWCAILATIIAFWRHSRPAALLLTPYLAWSTFAAALNFAVWQMN